MGAIFFPSFFLQIYVKHDQRRGNEPRASPFFEGMHHISPLEQATMGVPPPLNPAAENSFTLTPDKRNVKMLQHSLLRKGTELKVNKLGRNNGYVCM